MALHRMDPEILSPNEEPLRARARAGGSLFTDENLDLLSHVLDDCFRIPWTSIRFGIDGLIGLVPFAGDVLAGLASCILIVAAWFRGVPYITLARMVVNLALDVIIGVIPIVGDAFDIAWKANRRNYKLLSRELQQPHKHTWKDYVFLGCLALVLFLILAIPVAALAWLLAWMVRQA
jgi:hypothetical protein